MSEDQATYNDEFSRLDSLGQALAAKRKEAIEYRDSCGLVEMWDADQEAYDGIDDANRAEEQYQKPTAMAGRVTAQQADGSVKSTIYVNITQPYVDMAAARVSDMLLPTDDMPFGLEPTPIPDLILPQGLATEQAQVLQANFEQRAKEINEQASQVAKRAEKRIWDWLVQAQWHAEVRKVIEDAARLGAGVLKGPFPKQKKVIRVTPDGIAIELVIDPASKRIDVRNLFPAKGCGESIHNGEYIWERDYISKKKLMELKGSDYLDEQIDLCLKDGPGGSTDPKEKNEEKEKMYEIWYFHGLVEKEDMEAAGCECEDGVYALVTMVNNRVIKAVESPLDSGEFPYDVMPWQRKGGSWAGIGVSRQVRTPQRIINGASRRLMDNGGLSSAPLIFMARDGVEPVDKGPMGITPGRQYWVDLQDIRSVKDSVFALEIPTRQAELQGIIQYALSLAERLTSMPLMMQGQQGDASETVGGMALLQNNAGSVLRRIASLADDYVFEPHIRRYHEWLLIYGEENEKGDPQVVAKGSSALYERDAQSQAIRDLAAIVKDPAFEISPARWIVEWFKAQKLDPARFQLSDEEKQKVAQAQQPQDPRVIAVQQKAQTDKDKLQFEKEKAEFEANDRIAKREHEVEMALLARQTKMMELAAKGDMTLEQIKAELASDTMRLTVQERMAEKVRPQQVINTPMEPQGMAQPGRAFEQ